MICNKCNKNEATFFLEQNINGKITKIALCPQCAKEYNDKTLNPYSFNLLGGLFQSPSFVRQRDNEIKKCTLCASTFSDISKSGRVGCAECYKVFANELAPTVKRIHGNVKHIGRKPHVLKNAEADVDCKRDNIDDLKRRLREAIACEDYESAAVLRDKIRELSE